MQSVYEEAQNEKAESQISPETETASLDPVDEGQNLTEEMR